MMMIDNLYDNYDDYENNEKNPKKYEEIATAYRSAHVSNVSGLEIVAELYRGMIVNIAQAKEAYSNNELDKMCNLNAKTYKILIALQSNLNFEEGGETAKWLNTFYNSIFFTLSKAIRKPNTEAEFDRILEALKPVYKRWREFADDKK